MGDYHELYLKTDVLLLADVFEKFINKCLDYCGLDLCHYFSSPRLSWDSMLKMIKIILDPISDTDMHLCISKRISRANNKYMWSYDSTEESKLIICLDANNLYGWAMSQYLPCTKFKSLSEKEISRFCLYSISENSSVGYILEVDIEYPSELHDLHNDYLLASEKLEISQNMLSKYCFNIANEYGIKIDGVNKLVPNLRNKKGYVVHYRNLQFYLSLGMKLMKIYKILRFKQSDWLKNTLILVLVRKTVNSFEKDFLKLMNNSVFGKTMGNLRKRISVKLINNSKDYVRCVSKPSFISQKIVRKFCCYS